MHEDSTGRTQASQAREQPTEAARLGLTVVGTLGILLQAHEHGMLHLPSAIEELRAVRFQASEALFKYFMDLS